MVADSNVRAPFAGTVYSLPVSVSEYVSPGDLLLQMADLTKLQVRAYFDEPELGLSTQANRQPSSGTRSRIMRGMGESLACLQPSLPIRLAMLARCS